MNINIKSRNVREQNL